MAIKSFFKKLMPGWTGQRQRRQYAQMLDGSLPVFSSFGKDIYASDVVQAAVSKIAAEFSKLQPRHIRTDESGIITEPKSDYNRLFRFKPNPLMTTSEFLEKMIWILYKEYNSFIYPAYDIMVDNRGNYFRKTTGFYPLNPKVVTFQEDEASNLFVEMEFGGGNKFTLPYEDVIHIRKKFSGNDLMGGDRFGRPDNDSLIKVLEAEHTVLEGLQKAIPASLTIRGILKVNTLVDDELLEKERKRFEKHIKNNETGILATDLKSEYFPLQVDPKLVDKDTMAFLQEKILNWVGVPLKILTGDFAEEDYEVWYEQELEPLIIRMGQAFSPVLFTENELNHGNQMVFYQRNFMYMSAKSKRELLKIGGEQGLLTDNEKRSLIGYSLLEGEEGQRKTQSLNYVSVQIIDDYQMKRAGAVKDWTEDVDKQDDDPPDDDKKKKDKK